MRIRRSRPCPSRTSKSDDTRDEALLQLLSARPRTLVWDDVKGTTLATLVAHVAAASETRSQIVLVSRRFFTAREAGVRAAAFEVKPLSHADTVALVHALQQRNGRRHFNPD